MGELYEGQTTDWENNDVTSTVVEHGPQYTSDKSILSSLIYDTSQLRPRQLRAKQPVTDEEEPILIWGTELEPLDTGKDEFDAFEVARENKLVRVTNPQNEEMWVDVQRVQSIVFKNKFTGKSHRFKLNW